MVEENGSPFTIAPVRLSACLAASHAVGPQPRRREYEGLQ